MPTLKDVMPYEFGREFSDTPAYRFCDVEVVSAHGDPDDQIRERWPGPQKNVYFWVKLANGYAVGWNENPGRGWSFSMVKLRKDTK